MAVIKTVLPLSRINALSRCCYVGLLPGGDLVSIVTPQALEKRETIIRSR
jgi:hypothetical protein